MVAGGPPRARRGFTLIEILIVLALSFIGVFGMITVVVTAQRAAVTARAVSEATALAQDRVEQLLHVPLASLASSNEAGLGPQGVAVAGGAYSRVTTIAAVNTNTRIQVRVGWLDIYQRAHAVTLVTLRAQ